MRPISQEIFFHCSFSSALSAVPIIQAEIYIIFVEMALDYSAEKVIYVRTFFQKPFTIFQRWFSLQTSQERNSLGARRAIQRHQHLCFIQTFDIHFITPIQLGCAFLA